jgi:hypothetical protein
MHALPANIHPRAYFTQQNPAPYRAYDDDGDVYFRQAGTALGRPAAPPIRQSPICTLQRFNGCR